MHSDNQRCSRCHTYFVCGIQNGQDSCWCFELPQVVTQTQLVEGASTCVCPRCLASQIALLQRPQEAPRKEDIQ